jgi:hypothetical protein
LCPSAIWLDKGRVQERGPATDVIDSYLASTHADGLFGKGLTGEGPLRINSIKVGDGSGRPTTTIRRDSPFSISVDFSLEERLPGFDIALYVVNSNGVRVFDEAWSDREPRRAEGPGRYTVALKIPPVLNVDDYRVGLWAGTAYETLVHEPATSVFRLEGSTKRRPDRVVELLLPWELSSAQEDAATHPNDDGWGCHQANWPVDVEDDLDKREIENRKREIESRYGVRTAHNMQLHDDVYTVLSGIAGC